MRHDFVVSTTFFGNAVMSREQLYQLHREVAKAASEARKDDPQYVAHTEMGRLAARGR